MFRYEGFDYSLDQVTDAASKKGLSVDEYVDQFGLETVGVTEEIQTDPEKGKTNGAAAKGATATPKTGQAPEILVLDSEDTSLDLHKIDNSEAAIKKRRKENAKQDAILAAAKPIELEEVVVTGTKPLERDVLEYIGADVFAGGTPTERLRQHQKLQQYIQEKRLEFDVPEKRYYENTGSTPSGYDFTVDEDTFTRGKALGLFGKSKIERDYKNSDRTGIVFSYTGAKPNEDSNLRTIDIPKARQIFIENVTNQELSNQLKETDQDNLNFKVRAKGKRFVRDEEVEGEKLYDPFTGQVYSFDKAPDDAIKIYENAKNTEVKDLNNALTKQYYKVVALAKELNNYRESDFLNFDKGASQFQQGRTVSNLFLGDTKYETGLNLIQEIANTGEIPEDITKLKSDHPFAEAFNTALTDYVTINKAYQLNLDPTKQKKTTGIPGFFEGAWQTLVSKTPFGDVNPSPSTRLEEATAFVNVLEASGFQPVSEADISEALIASRGVTFGGGFADLSLWAGQVGATRRLPVGSGTLGTQIGGAIKSVNNFLKQTKLASRSKIVRSAMDDVAKGFDEAFVFVASDYAAHSVGLKDAPSPEEIYATSLFAFPMGGAQSFATRLLNKFPAKTVFTPMLAAMSKPKTLRGLQKNILGSSVGAASYMFASAANDFDGFAYEYDRFGNMTPKSTTDFIVDFIDETAKMSLLGSKSILHKNGLRTAFINDIRAMQGHNPLNVSRAAKRTGYNENSIKKPDENTVQDITNSREASLNELGKSLQDGVIDQTGFFERAKKINEDYGILESQAELNIAKEAIKAEDKSDLKPNDADIRTLVTRLQRGEKLTARDNNTMVNTPLPIIFDRYGIKPGSEQAKAIENAWNNETVLNEYLNNSPVFKAPFGSEEREESYKFLQDAVILSDKIKQLEKKKDLTEQEKIELEFLEEQNKSYQQGGYKYEKLQDKLNKFYKNLRAADIAQAENILSATKEGERVPVESVEELQKIYDKAFPNQPQNVSEVDGFYDANKKVYYLNETKVKDIKNFTVDTHETGHFILRDALKNERDEVTEDGIRIIDEVLAELTPKQREVVQRRIDAIYRFDSKGNEKAKKDYYEEYLTTLSDAIRSKQIVFKENIGNSLENLVPFLRGKGVENLELNAETGKNLFELIKSYSKGELPGIKVAKEMSIAAEKAGIEAAKEKSIAAEKAGIEAAKEKSRAAEGVEVVDKPAQFSLTTAQDLAVKFKSPEGLSRKVDPETGLSEKANFEQQVELIALEALGYKQGKGTISRDEAVSFVNQYIPGILRRFDPSKRQISTFITSNIKPKRQKFYEQQIGTKPLETRISDERAREIADTQAEPLETKTEATTDFKLVDAIKINKEPISPDTKAEIRKLVTKETEGIDPNSDTFRKKALKPGKELINFIKQELLGGTAMQDYRNFIRENPNFIKGLNIAQLIRFDTGLLKQGKPRLFTELNRKLTKQKEIEKFMMQGRIPYKTIKQIKAGANLYNRLKPTETQLVNFLTNDTPQTVSNRKTAIASAIATKFIAEATPSTEAFKSKSQAEQAKIAEKLQVSPAAKFSETKKTEVELKRIKSNNEKENKSGSAALDFVVNAESLANFRTNTEEKIKAMKSAAAIAAAKLGAFGIDKFFMPGNWTPGFNLPTVLKNKFNVISNVNKIKDPKAKKEALDMIANDELVNLADVVKRSKENTEVFEKKLVKAFQVAAEGKSGVQARKNAERKDLHDKGVSETIDIELEMFLESEIGEALVRDMLHNSKLNKNLNRNQALPMSFETGAVVNGRRREDTTDEHQYQAIEHAQTKLKLYKTIKNAKGEKQKEITKLALDLYKKWISENYTQFLLKKETDIISGHLKNDKGEVWENSGSNSHPLLKQKINDFIDLANKKGTTKEQLEKAFNEIPSADIRYFSDFGYMNSNFINTFSKDGSSQTKAQQYNVEVADKWKNNPNVIIEQGRIIESIILTEAGLLKGTEAVTRKQAKAIIDKYIKLAEGKTKAETKNNGKLPPSLSFTEKRSNEKVLEELGTLDKALKVARDPKAPVKKIRVFDFDDTLARSNSKVIYEMPDGKTGKLNATQFAERAGELEAQGATFDFAEFSKVVDGKKGPVFKAIENIVAKRGAEDVFILTARPGDAAGPIKEFMDALGVKIPIENIVGLGDGKAQAKARWVTGKAAEGYNDFFFVDDAYKNVKAVRDALEVFDVNSKTQQAKARFSETVDLNKDFNDIIEAKTGIGADKVYSKAKAQVVGASKGSIFKGIPYSAQDFTGLLYETLSKGKLGDQQMAWYKYNLIDPFARGVNDISRARVAIFNDYKSLKKELGIVPKNLRKKLPGEPYTREQAVRVYTWNTLQGMEVPGVSKADLKTLNEFVNNSPELKVFAEQLVAINKGDGYAKPKETWLTGSITTDLLEGLNTTKRAKYLEQWQTNVDEIFSEANLNKLEAAYGKKYRKALENSLKRMKTGRNRSFSDDSLTGRFTDWLNGSIGVTMFFNTRTSLLQTLSSINFVNFSDNNPLKAAQAFGNQKQYWKDFKYLMNSDFLKERRGGLRMNVNEADIAEAANKNGPRGVINKLLQFGFTPTQIADSFAIASGGATFYRNRIKTYEKQGLSKAEAETKAFEDFRETAEESQQSARPDRISMQQAGPLGRPILAYGNTPAQYVRLTDKAIKDLKAGRGDAKTNISKIIYYTTVQNLIFNSLQQGLFAIAFGEADVDDEKYEKKYIDVANGMADSILRGTGVGGAAVSVGKNAIIRIMREQEKKMPKLEKVGYELTKISPPVSSKLSKINQAARSYQWDKDEMISKGFSIDNPAYLAGANVIAATTNVPLDRAIKKVNNVIAATEADAELWERLALMGGWPEWSIEEPEDKKKKKEKSFKKENFFKKE